MNIIHAWIYDPSRPSLFKARANERSALITLSCDRANECDVFNECNSCLLKVPGRNCKFGRKSRAAGFTKRAGKFYSQMSAWRESHGEYFGKLGELKAWSRVFKIADHWYLPYSHMAKGIWGSGSPLDSKWLPISEMTAELMQRILTARPRAEFGGEITSYQGEEVPKFLTDIRGNYPELWALVSEWQKARLNDVDYTGRKAILATCLPGKFDGWEWDGKILRGEGSILLPVKGSVEITPNPDASLKVTDNSVVGPETLFAD